MHTHTSSEQSSNSYILFDAEQDGQARARVFERREFPEQGFDRQRLWLGLGRIGRALRHQLERFVPGRFAGVQIPWLKLALAGLAVYVLTHKDLRFSLDMKAPLSTSSAAAVPASRDVEASRLGASAASPERPPLAVTEAQVSAYIQRFEKVARAESQRFGIPVSIKMAQALLESQAGTSPEARAEQNHFGRPLRGVSYESAWANWRAHSLLLKRDFPHLFSLGDDYRRWAQALEKTGYSSQPGYADRLVRMIRHYELDRL